jgi:phage terminase large subunit-like protein
MDDRDAGRVDLHGVIGPGDMIVRPVDGVFPAEVAAGVADATVPRDDSGGQPILKHFKPWLTNAGFNESEIEQKWVEFGQGTQSMSPALRDLEEVIKEKELRHGDHPVLGMCATCAVVEGKDDANRKLSKIRSTGRIDGMVALAMAFGVCPLTKHVDVASLIG